MFEVSNVYCLRVIYEEGRLYIDIPKVFAISYKTLNETLSEDPLAIATICLIFLLIK